MLINTLKTNSFFIPFFSSIGTILLCLAISIGLFLSACQGGSTTPEKSLQEIKAENKNISNSAIIRNPITADQPIDTVNVAKMTFDHIRYRYGEVEEGAIVTHTFTFTNTGKAPLIISEAKSTCGCTVPEWPKEPIAVGESNEITVRFNTANKKKYQTKPVFITANTHPSETTLYLIGSVKEKVMSDDAN